MMGVISAAVSLSVSIMLEQATPGPLGGLKG